MTAVYVLLALNLVAILALIGLVLFVFVKRGNASVVDNSDEVVRMKSEIITTLKMENAMMKGTFEAQTNSTKEIAHRFDLFMNAVDIKLDKLKDDNAKNIAEVRNETSKVLSEVRTDNAKSIIEMKNDNAEQLEKMRVTVDEKLSSTLEKRFNSSFKIVNDRLEEINRSFADLQNLQTGVNDLKGLFKNIKTRGTWGEVALENLLTQILNDGQFEKQFKLSPRSNEFVDFAIKLPGKGDGEIYLPIDAKFPVEDYQRLVDASEKNDSEMVEIASKAIEARIKQEARSISEKYIKPPKTTDFAILYLPIEGLFAEVIKRHGLSETLQTKYRVVVCGPTTIAALLNSLQMGFRSVAIEKRSTEIGKLLTAFVKDFDTFTGLIEKTGKKLEEVQNTISKASKRNEIIKKKLNKVEQYDIGEPSSNAELLEGFIPENNDNVIDGSDIWEA